MWALVAGSGILVVSVEATARGGVVVTSGLSEGALAGDASVGAGAVMMASGRADTGAASADVCSSGGSESAGAGAVMMAWLRSRVSVGLVFVA